MRRLPLSTPAIAGLSVLAGRLSTRSPEKSGLAGCADATLAASTSAAVNEMLRAMNLRMCRTVILRSTRDREPCDSGQDSRLPLGVAMAGDEPLVTIATFPGGLEASLARGALEAAGIHAVVPTEAFGAISRSRGGPFFDQLQVFASDRNRALAELRRLEIQLVTPENAARFAGRAQPSSANDWTTTARVIGGILLAIVILFAMAYARNRAGHTPGVSPAPSNR
jgi:hypothetical protein